MDRYAVIAIIIFFCIGGTLAIFAAIKGWQDPRNKKSKQTSRLQTRLYLLAMAFLAFAFAYRLFKHL